METASWQVRRARLLTLLKHPWTVGDVKDLVPYPSMKTAYSALERLYGRGEIHHLGHIYFKNGKRGAPIGVWCRHDIASPCLLHDVIVSKSLGEYLSNGIEVLRHWELDKRILPDATILFGKTKIHWELERTKKSETAFAERIAKYAGCPDFVVWVAPDEAMKKWILARIEQISELAFVTTLDEVKDDPWGSIFEDIAGERVALKDMAQGH